MQQQQDTLEQAAPPTLCAAGCGFYSNVGTGGLCSKCYREQEAREVKMKAATNALSTALSKEVVPLAKPEERVEEVSSSSSSASATVPAPAVAPALSSRSADTPPSKPPSSTRCLMCNKKVGLTGFSCRCNPDAVFCSHHRYAEAHSCSFDYKAAQRQQLEESNPLVQASKVQRL